MAAMFLRVNPTYGVLPYSIIDVHNVSSISVFECRVYLCYMNLGSCQGLLTCVHVNCVVASHKQTVCSLSVFL